MDTMSSVDSTHSTSPVCCQCAVFVLVRNRCLLLQVMISLRLARFLLLCMRFFGPVILSVELIRCTVNNFILVIVANFSSVDA
jgi:hypothetical protein